MVFFTWTSINLSPMGWMRSQSDGFKTACRGRQGVESCATKSSWRPVASSVSKGIILYTVLFHIISMVGQSVPSASLLIDKTDGSG